MAFLTGDFWNPLHNEMLRFQIIQVLFVAAIYAVFGWVGVVGFIASATIGFLLLEIVNYIEYVRLSGKQSVMFKLECGGYAGVGL